MAASFDVSPWEAVAKGALAIDSWIDQGRAVVEIIGELDVYTTNVLREELLALTVPARYRVAVEMSGLDFIDSSGLGVLVGAAKRAAAGGGGLCLVGAQERVLMTLPQAQRISDSTYFG